MGEVDLGAGWDQFWNGLGFSQHNTFLVVIGVGIFAIGVVIFIVKKLRGSADWKRHLLPWALVGVVISSPTIAIPLIADIASAVINIVIVIIRGLIQLLG